MFNCYRPRSNPCFQTKRVELAFPNGQVVRNLQCSQPIRVELVMQLQKFMILEF
jgi:hypothetical protein